MGFGYICMFVHAFAYARLVLYRFGLYALITSSVHLHVLYVCHLLVYMCICVYIYTL